MITPPLTSRQQEVLVYLVQYTLEHLYQPTIREIVQHLGVSSNNGVYEHLKALEKKGYVVLKTGNARSRAIQLNDISLMFYKESTALRVRPIREYPSIRGS